MLCLGGSYALLQEKLSMVITERDAVRAALQLRLVLYEDTMRPLVCKWEHCHPQNAGVRVFLSPFCVFPSSGLTHIWLLLVAAEVIAW